MKTALPALLCLLALRLAAADPAAGWRPANVPGPLSAEARAAVDAAGGFAWYRTWVKVHDSFFTRHERNLYEESVGLHLTGLAGAHEAWVNGVRIGQGGAFPPAARDGRHALHRHKVPVGTLRKGEWNEVAFRVHTPPGGPAGFLGEAPFIMNYFMECVFAGPWEFRPGDGYHPGPALPQRPAASAFDTFRESNRVLGRTAPVTGPRLTPAESARALVPAPGLRVELVLHEPQVAQPFHFSFDERGRLWVTHSRQYPYPAGVRMISRDKYYRAHYDRTPPPPPGHDRGADVVSIHASSRGDGVLDRHSVFLEGLNMANAAVRGRGGVWVMHTPYLLFYPDRDGDDRPDGPPEVRLAGFGLEDSHSIANGLVWGPDGWLYGAQGSTTSSRVTRPGTDAPDAPGVVFEGCMVWRYHPDTRAYEIFAEGGGNTFGLEFDAAGRLYSGHNGGNTRGWHFVQGGFYLMQGVDPGKFGPPRNPYAFGDLPLLHTADRIVRFTHFGAFGDGTALPVEHAGRLFALDPLHNLVTLSDWLPRGSTFATADRGAALQGSDPAFRPVYIANGPDGALYVADMYDFYVAHGQHYQNQIDPETGRIYRLRGAESRLEADSNLAAKSSSALAGLLGHPNKWHRVTAARLLGERRDPVVPAELRRLLAAPSGLAPLHALWALHQAGALAEDDARAALAHPQAVVRAWTTRLLGDTWGLNRNLGAGQHARATAGDRAGRLPAPLFAALLRQARAERDPEALAQFASTARRLDPPQALPLLAAVMARREVADDPFIPLLCWWVLEAHLPGAAPETLALFEQAALWDEPVAAQHVLPRLARRLAVEGRRQELAWCARLLRLAPSPAHAAPVLQGLEEAFRGRPMTDLPEELAAALQAAGRVPLALRLRRGEPAALAEALRIAGDPKARPEERLRLVRALAEIRDPAVPTALLALAAGPASADLKVAALNALGAQPDAALGARVAALLPGLREAPRLAALNALAGRPAWSQVLLGEVAAGRLAARDVPAEIAARLRESPEPAVRAAAERLLPPAPAAAPAADLRGRVAALAAVIRAAPGNPYAGEATYAARCASCHRLFFKGGNVGPELTNYQRDHLDTLLPSILAPDAEIREGYQYHVAETTDGRSVGGFILDRDHQVTVLRGLDGENVTLRAADLKSLQPLGRSLMPAGLLDGLGEQELRDFFAYLRISQPISR